MAVWRQGKYTINPNIQNERTSFHTSRVIILTFTAPYLPWVLLGFSLMLGSSPLVDLLGMGAGHLYYFFHDVYPQMTGRRLLRTPWLIRLMFNDDDTTMNFRLEEERQFLQPDNRRDEVDAAGAEHFHND